MEFSVTSTPGSSGASVCGVSVKLNSCFSAENSVSFCSSAPVAVIVISSSIISMVTGSVAPSANAKVSVFSNVGISFASAKVRM